MAGFLTTLFQGMRPSLNNSLFDPEFFEHISCNLCGTDEAQVLFEADAMRIPKTRKEFIAVYSSGSEHIFYERLVRCRICGLIYLSPRPRCNLITDGYFLAKDERYISQEKSREKTFRSSLKIIKRLCPTGKLLDIGAASGTFIKVASQAGFEASGIEPSGWMCDFAKKNYNVKILPVLLEDAKFPDNSFDIITMWDVLEHTPNPMNTLKEATRILKPGGLLFINYPRIDDLLAKIFGRKWWFLLSIHLFYFTPKTLSSYMEKLGFKKLLHKMHIQSLEYSYLVQRLNAYTPALANIAKLAYIIPGVRNLSIPYFASQYLLIARKKQ